MCKLDVNDVIYVHYHYSPLLSDILDKIEPEALGQDLAQQSLSQRWVCPAMTH